MYIVQGITTKYQFGKSNITCYNILDTKDGIAEDVNIDLLNKDDLVFGERLSIATDTDYGRLYYSRSYNVVGVNTDNKKPLMVCDTLKTWNISKEIDGVVIDDLFSFSCNKDKSISIKKVNTTGDTKIRIELEKVEFFENVSKVHVYVGNYLCCSNVYNSTNLELGICEIEQSRFGVNMVYRIHIALIGSKDSVMYDDLYFDLDIENETLWFKGDTPAIPLNTINNIKKKLGGML